MNRLLKTLIVICLLLSPSLVRAQGGRADNVVFRGGVGIGGVSVAICQPLATIAASVTSNIATYTMSSNPQVAGFVAGRSIMVAGFTGGDTYYNAGTITNNVLAGGQLILSVTPTTIVASLTHANAAAGSNGTVLQFGNTVTSCAGLSLLYTDSSLGTLSANPVISDGLGNYGFWTSSGNYFAQFYGATVTTQIKYVTVPAPSSVVSILTNQIAFGTAPGQLGGSNNLTYTGGVVGIFNSGVTTLNIGNPTLATNVLNQNSPSTTMTGNYWNGGANASDTWKFQIIEGVGANPTTEYRVTGGASSGGALVHVLPAMTVDGNFNASASVLVQHTVFEGTVAGLDSYVNQGNTPATNGVNVDSGKIRLYGNFWNGAASATDNWSMQTVQGAGTNPTSTLSFVHTGSPGLPIASIPGVMYTCGTIAAAGACVPASSGNSHCFSGIATLGGGTSTITAISPPFTSSATYKVVTNDLTTIANPSKGVPASGSSITFTGTGTDNLSFIACGE